MYKKLILLILNILTVSSLTACGGGSGPLTKEDQLKAQKAEQEKWQQETRAKFDAASDAVERAKSSIAKANKRDLAKVESALAEAQRAIQDVAERQAGVINQMNFLFVAFEQIGEQNDKLEKEKAALQNEKMQLEHQQRLFSMGFYAALGTALITIVALLAKLPTAFLDREHRKYEILQKRIELRKLRREVTAPVKAQVRPIRHKRQR